MSNPEQSLRPELGQIVENEVGGYFTKMATECSLSRFQTAYTQLRYEDRMPAADYLIATLPEALTISTALGAYASMNYLSDISPDEQRGGGFNGLQGSDDARRLKRSLLGTICAWPACGEESVITDGLSEHGYAAIMDNLVARSIGLAKYGQLLDTCNEKGGDYDRMDPATKVTLLREVALVELAALEAPAT